MDGRIEVGKLRGWGTGNGNTVKLMVPLVNRIKIDYFPYPAFGKSSLSGAAIAQFIGFRCQVSGVRELRC
jgi:hypothetical protein